MKILILGDFSGFGINLKYGFEKNGTEVTLISNGDGWKKIAGSNLNLISYFKINNKPVNKVERIIIGLKNRNKIKKFIKEKNKEYDIIFLINTGMIFTTFLDYFRVTFSVKDLKKILKENGKIYLSACGDDYFYLTKSKKILKYFPYDSISNKIINFFLKKEKKVHNYVEGVIPISYDYAIGYKNSDYFRENKVLKTIPLPINTAQIQYNENKIKEKIVIFHGVSREEFKGSYYIKEAMERIKKKYGEKVEIIIKERMPLIEYEKVLEKANIIIDQCKFYGYGMNAIYSMAMGKVVLSGNELENQEELNLKSIPVINIRPDIEDIEKKIEYLIENPNLVSKLGKESREFIEKIHATEIIAKKYLEIFEKNE